MRGQEGVIYGGHSLGTAYIYLYFKFKYLMFAYYKHKNYRMKYVKDRSQEGRYHQVNKMLLCNTIFCA